MKASESAFFMAVSIMLAVMSAAWVYLLSKIMIKGMVIAIEPDQTMLTFEIVLAVCLTLLGIAGWIKTIKHFQISLLK